MSQFNWSNWYSVWGWFLWFGVVFLFFSVVGNFGYTYRVHKRFSDLTPKKGAIDILDERYALGEITHEEYTRMKTAILTVSLPINRQVA